ncbi:MAG: zinc ribbon domain-containing protein, partial [Anaerolineales bacterium]
NPSGFLYCEHCHAHIIQGQLQCPSCQTLNPIGHETCMNCAEPLTILGRVISRQGLQTKSQRLEQMRQRASAIKAEAQSSSDARMAEFVEMDRRRIQLEREAVLVQQEKDRLLFRNVAIGIGIFLLVVVLISLVILL